VVKWSTFEPSDIEYDFENDKLAAHHISFDEAVEDLFSSFEVRGTRGSKTGIGSSGQPSAGAGSLLSFSSSRAMSSE
jgi:hypothetical protein